jgi:hypothetical protein
VVFHVAVLSDNAELMQRWTSDASWDQVSFECVTRILHPWLTDAGERAPITWRERAEREGVILTPHVRSLDFNFQRTGMWCWEGQLDLPTQVHVAGVLSELTDRQTEVSYFFGTSAQVCGHPSTLYRGALQDLAAVRDDFRCYGDDQPVIGPESWWPDDRRWLVHTHYDSSATDVYGPAALGDRLSADPDVETFAL